MSSKSFVKDLAVYSPSQFLPALTAFVTTPILTRLFLPAEYGHWAVAASISSFLVALAVSGMGSAVLRYYPSYKERSALKTFFATISVSTVMVIIGVTGVSLLLLIPLKQFLPSALYQLIPLILLIFIAQSIFTVFISAVRAQELGGSFTTYQLFVNYGSLGFGLLLVLAFGLRIDGLLWGTFLALILVLPILISRVVRLNGIHPQHFHFGDALEIWQYAWPLTLGNVAMWGLRVSDLFIIGASQPERDIGLYTVSYNISAKSIELLVTLFLLSVSPLIFRTWEVNGRNATEDVLTMVTRTYLILCLPAAVGLTILALPFVTLLATPEYYAGYRIVGFVVFSSFLWGLANMANAGMAIQKKAIQLGINQIIAAAIHIGLQLFLVPRFGYVASAVSTLIGYATLLTLNAVFSQPHLTWHFPFRTLINVGMASIAMGLAASETYHLSEVESLPLPISIFLGIAVAIPVYGGCLWLLNEVKADEKDMFQHLWKRMTGGQHV